MNDRLRSLLEKIQIVDHEEYLEQLRQGGILICMGSDFPSSFTDNQFGECKICRAPIQFRPYNAVAVNKVCLVCAADLSQAGEA